MYKYLSSNNQNEKEAILYSEGRVLVLSDDRLRRFDIAIRHLCFLIDFMRIEKDDVLLLNLYKDQEIRITTSIKRYLSDETIVESIATINENNDIDVQQDAKFTYLIILGIETIKYPLNVLVDNLIARSRNVYLCGDIEEANRKDNYDALSYFVNSHIDEKLFLNDYLKMTYDYAEYKVQNKERIEREKEEKVRKAIECKNKEIRELVTTLLEDAQVRQREYLEFIEQERIQKSKLLANIVTPLVDYVTTYNRLDKQQYWVIKTTATQAKYMLSTINLEQYHYFPINKPKSAIIAKRELYSQYQRDITDLDKYFKAWWNMYFVMQDNDIILLYDTTSFFICGIGRVFIDAKDKKEIIWINKQINKIDIQFDNTQWNPIRVEGKENILLVKKSVERILRGY